MEVMHFYTTWIEGRELSIGPDGMPYYGEDPDALIVYRGKEARAHRVEEVKEHIREIMAHRAITKYKLQPPRISKGPYQRIEVNVTVQG
jgi:hypothetical protein